MRLVDDTVFGCVVLRSDRLEQGLLGTQNLDGGGWALRQVDQAASMADQSRAHKLSDHAGEVGSQSLHPVLEILLEGSPVIGQLNNLVTQRPNELLIDLADFSTHGDLGGSLGVLLDVLGEDPTQIGVGCFCPDSDSLDSLGVDEVVSDDLGEFGEVPAVPLPQPHHVVVDLLIQVVQQRDGLDDHRVHLLRRELEFVPGESVGHTQRHHLQVLLVVDCVREWAYMTADSKVGT